MSDQICPKCCSKCGRPLENGKQCLSCLLKLAANPDDFVADLGGIQADETQETIKTPPTRRVAIVSVACLIAAVVIFAIALLHYFGTGTVQQDNGYESVEQESIVQERHNTTGQPPNIQ